MTNLTGNQPRGPPLQPALAICQRHSGGVGEAKAIHPPLAGRLCRNNVQSGR